MKPTLLATMIALALAALPATALAENAYADADEPAPAPEPEKKKTETVHFMPTGGWVTGQWMGVPVTRPTGGLDLLVVPKKGPVAFDVTVLFGSGSTENGLDAKRFEVGSAVSSKPGLFRVAGGAHLSYAWLTRETMPGKIAGIGIGAHAYVEGAIPLGEAVALTFGLRGSADLYDGGYGYEGGPFGGLRF